LVLIHSDVWGPTRTPSEENDHRYAINFIDDYSRHIRVYTMKTKDEALNKFKQYIADTATIGNELRVKCLRTDNGGEYTSTEFNKF